MSDALRCRSCGATNGALVIDLGTQPLANNLLRGEDLGRPEPAFPLAVFVCPSCWLLQLTETVPPVRLFSEYLYFSSFSDAMVRHAREAAERYIADFQLGPASRVIEIASNDGYLLQNFQRAGIPCLGIEPAANIARVARDRGIETRVEFFNRSLGEALAGEGKQADLILGNNVFAHVPDINGFVSGLKAALKPGGRFVLEFPYAVDLIEHAEFDTVYHEHVFYFALTPLRPLFHRHGLEVTRVDRLAIHGGSLRLFGGHCGAPVHPSVATLLEEEQARRVNDPGGYAACASRFHRLMQALRARLAGLKSEGRRLAGYGASAKGSTLLNYCRLGRETLDFVADRSPHKQGRFTPGTHLPIVGPEQLLARRPDHTLLLTWNFAREILEQQQEYIRRGGKFILPYEAAPGTLDA